MLDVHSATSRRHRVQQDPTAAVAPQVMAWRGLGLETQAPIGIAPHLKVELNASAWFRGADHVLRIAGHVPAQAQRKTLAFDLVIQYLELRLGRSPGGVAKQKGQTMPDLVAMHTHRPETPPHQLERDWPSAQLQSLWQRLVTTVQCQLLTR
jgi:hypothetical protein